MAETSGPWRRGDGWRTATSGNGERPRLQLKPRGGGGKDGADNLTERMEGASISTNNDAEDTNNKSKREPKVINSRAAAFGAAPENTSRKPNVRAN